MIEVTGSADIPVACGRETPLEVEGRPWHGAFPNEWRIATDRAYGVDLPEPLRPASEGFASDVLRDAITEADGDVTVVSLGPLTNLADAFALDAELAELVDRVVVMGGALDVPGNVPDAPTAEYNVWADPASANAVLGAGAALTLIPLDATGHVPVTAFFAETLAEHHGTPAADVVNALFEAQPYLTQGASFFWDPLAAEAAVGSEGMVYERRRVSVLIGPGPQTGAVVDDARGSVVTVAVDVDPQAFERELLTTLNGGVAVSPPSPNPDISVVGSIDACAIDAPERIDGDTLVVSGANPSGVATEAVLVRFVEGGSYSRLVRVLERTSGPIGGKVPSWIEVVAYMPMAAGTDALGAWEVREGSHAILCVEDPGVVRAVRRLTVG